MNKEEKKVDLDEMEQTIKDIEDEMFDYDDEDLILATKIHAVKGKAKKVGKVALVIGGIALLGVVGVGVAIAVGAAKKEEEETKERDRSNDGYYHHNRHNHNFDESYRDEEGYDESETAFNEAAYKETTEAA